MIKQLALVLELVASRGSRGPASDGMTVASVAVDLKRAPVATLLTKRQKGSKE